MIQLSLPNDSIKSTDLNATLNDMRLARKQDLELTKLANEREKLVISLRQISDQIDSVITKKLAKAKPHVDNGNPLSFDEIHLKASRNLRHHEKQYE